MMILHSLWTPQGKIPCITPKLSIPAHAKKRPTPQLEKKPPHPEEMGNQINIHCYDHILLWPQLINKGVIENFRPLLLQCRGLSHQAHCHRLCLMSLTVMHCILYSLVSGGRLQNIKFADQSKWFQMVHQQRPSLCVMVSEMRAINISRLKWMQTVSWNCQAPRWSYLALLLSDKCESRLESPFSRASQWGITN